MDPVESIGPQSGSLLGATVGDFEIEAVIGSGSFGMVYRGRQRGLDRQVAIKVPTYEIAADPVQAERFAREARAAARVVHPGVVAIYAVGELDDGRPYLAMQLIDGVPLDDILEGGPLPPRRALGVARDIASALSETHAAGVVHRDLKPSNVMWRRDRNGDDRITLVDFGIAVCRPGGADATRLTSNGLIGTPHYMSPEQVQGDRVDARADLYALGCLLFELVTGTTLYDGSGIEVLLGHLHKPAPRAAERIAGLPVEVEALLARLLQKAPGDRPASADAVVAMIDQAIAAIDADADARVAARAHAPVRAARPRRRWWLTGAVASVALAGAFGAGYALHGAGGDDDEPEPAAAPGGDGTLRLISSDDGELIVRALVPETIHVNTSVRTRLEIKTKLGGQFHARQVVVTIEDPSHHATAQTAQLRAGEPGHYSFRHTFTAIGTYVVRMFPSETETVSTIELTVEP
ncbi:MAG TPA: serine/threonine-protein kinase [Kofleriaceae bacterium]